MSSLNVHSPLVGPAALAETPCVHPDLRMPYLCLHAVVIRARYPVIIDMTGPHAAGMKLGQILNTRAILNIVTLKKGHLLSK